LPLALFAVRGGRGHTWWWAAALLASLLPYAHFDRWTDIARFGLASTTWVAVLAGVGMASVPKDRLTPVVALLAASLWLASEPLEPTAAWRVEHIALRQLAPLHEAVYYDGRPDPVDGFAVWSSAYTGVPWYALHDGERAPSGALVWLGRGNAWYPPAAPCWQGWTPVDVADTELTGWPLEPIWPKTASIGLVRCE
jgi:hypothetical protein